MVELKPKQHEKKQKATRKGPSKARAAAAKDAKEQREERLDEQAEVQLDNARQRAERLHVRPAQH